MVYSNAEFKKTLPVDLEWIPCVVVMFSEKGDDGDTPNTISSIKVDNIKMKGTDYASSVVRACDTDGSHHNWTDHFDLAKFPKAFNELNSNYFGKAL